MKKDDRVYPRHILDAIEHIEKYAKVTEDYEDFCKNEMAHDAVIRQLGIIGEAAKRVSTTVKDKASEVPWKDVTGMRDKLIHDYFGIDLTAVWKAAKEDIPILKRQVQECLKELA